MNSFFLITLLCVLFFVIWLLPLHFVIKWAQRRRKRFNLVALVGLAMSWPIAWIVAAAMPAMSNEIWAVYGKRNSRQTEKTSTGDEILFYGLGVLTLILLGFMGWMYWMAMNIPR